MVTTRDVAREAGVSQGTVSNVLNRTGKVSSEKIARVEEAIKKLGYKTNIQAQKLKMGPGKSVCLLLPSLKIPHYLTFFESLRRCLFDDGIELRLQITDDLQDVELKCIGKIYEDLPALVITCTSLPSALSYQMDIPVLFLDRFPPERKTNQKITGFSYLDAGKKIGEYLKRKKAKKIAIFSSSSPTLDQNQFALALEEAAGEDSSITFFRSDNGRIKSKAIELASRSAGFDAVVTEDSSRAESLLDVNKYTGKELPEIITLSEKSFFYPERTTPYVLDYAKLGRNVALAVSRYLSDGIALDDMLMPAVGFRRSVELSRMSGGRLSILTLDSPASESLEMLLPDFRKRTAIDVTFETRSYEDIYRIVSDPDAHSRYDIIRIDMAWLPEIAGKVFRQLDSTSATIREITSHFLPEIGEAYSVVDGKMYSLPFDPSVQLLFYNREVFSNAKTARIFFEKHKMKLTVPKTFEEYDRIASFFTKRINPNSPTEFGHVMVNGSSAAVFADFIQRIDISPFCFRTVLENPETLKALKAYAASTDSTDGKIHLWWGRTIESFSSGECAMLRVFMNHAPRITNSKYSAVVEKVGFSQIPGGHPLLGGGAIGITRESRSYSEAIEFLKWIYSDEIARLYTLFGGTSPNESIYSDAEILSIYPWLSIAKEGFSKGRRRFEQKEEAKHQRILEDAIGYAVRSTSNGAMSAEDAVRDALSKYHS